MTTYNVESFYRATLAQTLLAADTVAIIAAAGWLKISNTPLGTYSSTNPWYVTISPNTDNEEIFEFTAVDSTNKLLTISKRGISKIATSLTTNWAYAATGDYNNSLYMRSHTINDSVRMDISHLHINLPFNWLDTLKVDIAWDTMAGPLKFSGTTNQGIVVNSLTTTQRTALTPDNGAIVYDSTIGENYQYISWTWNAVSSWSVQPNASLTVSGKVEIGTQTQVDASTDTWETGAFTVLIPSTFQSWITNRISDKATAETGANNTKVMTPLRTKESIQVNCPVASSVQKGIVEMATDSEVVSWTDQERYVNPKQSKDNYWFTFIPWTEIIAISSTSSQIQNSGWFVKAKEILIKASWTYRISFGLWCSSTTWYATIYKNGVSFGTARSTTSTSAVTFTEDLTFTAWDLCQLYYNAPWAPNTIVNNFSVNVTIIPNSIIPTVNL